MGIKVMDTFDDSDPFVLHRLVKIHFGPAVSVNTDRVAILGCTEPEGGSGTRQLHITIQDFQRSRKREKATVGQFMFFVDESENPSAARGGSRNFRRLARTSRYRRHCRTPWQWQGVVGLEE